MLYSGAKIKLPVPDRDVENQVFHEDSEFFSSLGHHFSHCIFIDIDFSDRIFSGIYFYQCSFYNCSFKRYNYFTNCLFCECSGLFPKYITCPSHGSFIGWKKICSENGKPLLAKLEIPADARRTSGNSRKCRANKVKVLSITSLIGLGEDVPIGYSYYYKEQKIIYRVGETVIVDNYNDSQDIICAGGIHFFLTREEALAYNG